MLKITTTKESQPFSSQVCSDHYQLLPRAATIAQPLPQVKTHNDRPPERCLSVSLRIAASKLNRHYVEPTLSKLQSRVKPNHLSDWMSIYLSIYACLSSFWLYGIPSNPASWILSRSHTHMTQRDAPWGNSVTFIRDTSHKVVH